MNPKRPIPDKQPSTVQPDALPDVDERRQRDERAADRGGHNITGGYERDPSTPFER